ncbi:MAG: inositol monophosphatase, partial [bacterium]
MSTHDRPWLEDVLLSTGEYQRNAQAELTVEDTDLKGRVDLVTEIDHTSENRIVEAIRNNCPEDSVLAEESFQHSGTSNRTWIIDPLDGTTNYVHGHPFYGISVGLQVDDQIESGMTYFPESEDLYWASSGQGSFKNGEPISVSETESPMDSFLATGFADLRSENSDLRYNLEVFPDILENVQGIRRAGSAVHDLCLLAEGVFDGFWEFNLEPWDVAAGSVIVEEAGGTVTDVTGGNGWLNDKNITASNGAIHEQLKEWIMPHLPDSFP